MKEINSNTMLKNGKKFWEVSNIRWLNEESAWPPQSFQEIFGDLSDCVFVGDLDLSNIGLNSLQGCPQKVKGGNFQISRNFDLKSLDYFPTEITKDFKIAIDFDLIYKLKDLDISIYRDLGINIFYGAYYDKKISKEEVFKKIAHTLSEYRGANGSFNRVFGKSVNPDISLDYIEIERFYRIYKKLDFDLEKFNRAVALL